MRVGVYGLPASIELAAAFSGCRDLGWKAVWRNHNAYRQGETEPFDAVILSGLRGQGGVIRSDYGWLDIPVVVIDYGYLNRVSGIASFETGHWQVGVNRLGWVPDFPCPCDRLEALGIARKARARRGERIYLCGQHAGDPSHGLDRDGIVRWALASIEALRKVTGREIVWRPHPDSPVEIGSVATSHGPLDWDDVEAVVTINSNIGLEALIEDVPVIARADAPYADLASEIYREGLPGPRPDQLTDYLRRVSYAQWTLAEIGTGHPLRWLARTGAMTCPN